MEFKGTKGEWYCNRSEPIEVRASNKSIAFVTIHDFENKDLAAHANAKLIEQAPNLLHALQVIASNSNDHAIIRIAIKAIEKALK